MTQHATAPRRRPPAQIILAVPLLAAVLLALFAWPSARLAPRDLPIGVSGPPPAVAGLTDRLEADGRADVRRYATAAAARAAVEDREVYGAFVAEPSGMTLLTASAAAPVVAQQLARTAGETGMPVTVRDVVPATPAAAGLPASMLPLILAGVITGVVAVLCAVGGRRRLALVSVGSVLVGLTATAILQGWLDVVGGDWAWNAAAVSLLVFAVGMTVAGAEALFGRAGIALASVTMVLLGNPLSAAASAPELLPQPIGVFGQLLPPGAGASLLRSTGAFDGAGSGAHIAVLSAWALAGVAALAIARLRRAAPSPGVVPVRRPATAS